MTLLNIMEEPKKKRGRKPLNQKKEIDKNIIKAHINEIDEHKECLIAHIPLTDDYFDCSSLVDKDIENDILLENNLLKKEVLELKGKLENFNRYVPYTHEELFQLRKYNLPIENVDNLSKNHEIVCWWCCHKFDEEPVFLPHTFVNGIFSVSGHFCSFNCLLAYNYSSKEPDMYVRNNLINLMFKMFSKKD